MCLTARIGFDGTAGFDDIVLHVGQLSLQSSDIFFYLSFFLRSYARG